MKKGINGVPPGKTVRKLLRQLAPVQDEICRLDLVEPNRLYDMARQGDRTAKLLRNLIAQLLNKHTGEEWWSHKAPTAEASDLLWSLKEWQAAAPGRSICILSSPAGTGEEREACIAGKRSWLRSLNLDGWPAIFDSNKAAYATSESMLIDDQRRKVEEYSAAGGHGAWFPFRELVIPEHITTIHIDMDGVIVQTMGPIYSLLIDAFKWHRQQEVMP